MGFVKKIIAPSSTPRSIKTVAATTPPPVVADTVESDSAAAYEQKASNKKGLLSTILSKQHRQNAANQAGTGNTTLG